VLKTHLEASLLDDDGPSDDLAAAAADHRRLLAAREERMTDPDVADAPARTDDTSRARPGDRSRTRELRSRWGWAWTRIVRTHDDYERVLEHLADARNAATEREPTAI
jgi:hypothetical protein